MKFKSLAAFGASAAMVMALAGVVLLPGVAGANPNVLYVAAVGGSNGGNSCQSAAKPCATISFAVSVAAPGAKIKLQAGTYNEQVAITKPVTIIGAGATSSIIKPTAEPNYDSDTDSSQPQFYVVDVKDTTGVTLEDLGIDGTAATSSFGTDGDGCGQDPVGIYYHDASGKLTEVAVNGIEMPTDLFGCQGGQGVYVATDAGSATPSNVTMAFVLVTNYDKNGITCDDPGTYCNIAGSKTVGIGSTSLIAQNGIQIWAAGASLNADVVNGNTYDGPYYAASGVLIGNPSTLTVSKVQATSNDSNIYLLQDQQSGYLYCGNLTQSCTNPAASGTTFTLSKNTASNGTNTYGNPIASGYGDGIDVDSVTTPTSVSQNTASSDPGNGIALYGATGVSVVKNTLSGDGNGLYLGSGTVGATALDSYLASNTVTSAAVNGILADTASSGNDFQKNSSTGSAAFDARDNSTGSGAQGTADGWVSNTCTTSSPAGLCQTRGHGGNRAVPASPSPSVRHALVGRSH
jgi:parallel beta-helix repeat protein